jgi:hypothetical protein
MKYQLTIALLLAVTTTFVCGCHCGSEPAQPRTEEPATEAAVEPAVDEGPVVSAEVQAILDAGDATAIAADMERLAAALAQQATATGTSAKDLETVAETMTGREKALDPRDTEDVASIETSASELAEGAVELEQDIAALRQLVIDLQAESNALYGRPAQ